MAFPVVWTQNAFDDYEQVVDYLLKNWSFSVAENFIATIEKRIRVLTIHPTIGIASKKDLSVRKIIITKHNKLYYRIAKDKIEILNIFDTRQDPEKDLYQ